ncbi:MAG: hypothetical protein GXO48_06885 [Chlorobi bacterium]|nr:hypothetical protein [Chlorobiota bacterium]
MNHNFVLHDPMRRGLTGWILLAILSISFLNGSLCLVDDIHTEHHATHTPFCSIPHMPMSIPQAETNTTISANSEDSYSRFVTDEDIPESFLLSKPWRPPWVG